MTVKNSDSTATSNNVTLSGTVSETVAKPAQKPGTGSQPLHAAMGGGELKVLNAKGETLATATIGSDGSYTVSVTKGSNYTLRATKGNVCLKSFIEKADAASMMVQVDPASSAVVKALAKKLGNDKLGEPGEDVSTAIAASEVPAYLVAIRSDTAALSTIAQAIAADISSNANYTATTGTAGATSTAGDATASTLSTNITTTVTVTAQSGAPSAPTGVTADPGDGWVTVSWAAVAGATSYNLYYSTTSGTAGIKDGSFTGTSTTVAGLTNGVTYYFTVTAVNASGESAGSAQAGAAPRLGTWKTVTTNARISQSTAVVNGIIYVIGGNYEIAGYGFAGWSTTVEAYDPATNTWTTKASMTTKRRLFATAVVNGIIYIIGGQWEYGAALTMVEAYNPATDTWTAKASMPTARGALSTAVVNGIIYAIGGEDYYVRVANTYTTVQLNVVEAYDPVTNTWSTKTPMPTARGYFSANAVNGIIYTIAGYDGAWMSKVEAYNPATNTWTAKASMPTARGFFSSVEMGGIIFTISGNNGGATPPTVEAYNPATNTWTTKTAMPTARGRLSAAVMDGIIYAIGGEDYYVRVANTFTEVRLSTVEAYNPATNTWTTKEPMTIARSGFSAHAVSGIIYAIAGYNGAMTSKVEAYNPATNTWTTKAPMPSARGIFCDAEVNGIIFIISGNNSNPTIMETVEAYDPATNTWASKPPIPTPRYSPSAAVVNGAIYVFGGYSKAGPLASNVDSYQ